MNCASNRKTCQKTLFCNPTHFCKNFDTSLTVRQEIMYVFKRQAVAAGSGDSAAIAASRLPARRNVAVILRRNARRRRNIILPEPFVTPLTKQTGITL